MPKFGEQSAVKKTPKKKTSKKTPTKKVVANKAATKEVVELPDDVVMSDEVDDDQEIIILQGLIGSGKTFTAASVSEYFPDKLPARRKTNLEDCFWLQYDRKATAGFKHNKLRVQTFDVGLYMNEHNKDVIEATERGINAAYESEAEWLVVDTLSGLDARLLNLNRRLALTSNNKYEPFKLNLIAHAELYDKILDLGMSVIFCCHSRTFDQKKDEQGKSAAISIAGGSKIVPDLTGQAPKIYKRDATLQIYCYAYYNPQTKSTNRKLYIGTNEQDAEGKNRYEGLLPNEQEPPNLRKLLDIAWKG